MLSPQMPLKTLPEKPKPCGWPYKNLLRQKIQQNTFSQSIKRVRINDTSTDVGDLKADGSEFV